MKKENSSEKIFVFSLKEEERKGKSMKVNITTKNFSSNAGVREVVEKELKRVEKMFAPDTLFDVCIKKYKDKSDRDYFKCDITIKNGKNFIRGYGEADSVISVVDFAVDALKRKARKIKTLNIKKRKGYADFLVLPEELDKDNTPEFDISVSRVKELDADVMTPEDAIVQMELSGHDFFVFKDDVGTVNIIYKRNEGYGQIIVN